jgi:hypothetical protein
MILPSSGYIGQYPCSGPGLLRHDGQRAIATAVIVSEALDAEYAVATAVIVEVSPAAGEEDYAMLTCVIRGKSTWLIHIVNAGARAGAQGGAVTHNTIQHS